MTDASGTTTYGYDDHDRLATKATPQGTLSYTYDPAGNVATMQSSNANGVSVAYTYDSLNRLATVVDNRLPAGANATTYAYDPASNLATVTYPNGLQSTFQYDDLNRVTALNNGKASYTYTLGPTGSRQSATESSGRTLNWSYDGIYRLTNETITLDPMSKNGTVAYGLDPVGNRLSQTSSIPGIPTASFLYDFDDRIQPPTESYHPNGNTLVSGSRTFTYDFANRLKSMTMSGSPGVTLVYDGDGNRVAKTVGATTTRYLVDDLNPTSYDQVVEEIGAGGVQRTYTYGLQRINQIQLVNSTWAPSFYGYDGLGSVRQLTNSTGTVTDTYDYDAWGNAVNTTGSTSNVYLYRGEQYDPDLNLYYLRARYLNPLTGTFLTTDPEEGATAEPSSFHRYAYAAADPVDRIDPSGRASCGAGLLISVPGSEWYLAFSPSRIGSLSFMLALKPASWSKCGCCDPMSPDVLRGATCALASTQWGLNTNKERFFWITQSNGTCGVKPLPYSNEEAQVTINLNTKPANTCAMGHTHPGGAQKTLSPMPTKGKDDVAAKGAGVKCDYVYSRNAVWGITADGDQFQISSGTWWKPYEKTKCKKLGW
jgi:RHS repeat-associated protein